MRGESGEIFRDESESIGGQGRFSRGVYSVRDDISPNGIRRCVRGEDGRWWVKPAPEAGDFLTVVLAHKHGEDAVPEGGVLAAMPSQGATALANARLFAASPALYEYVARWAEAGDGEAERLVRMADEGVLHNGEAEEV